LSGRFEGTRAVVIGAGVAGHAAAAALAAEGAQVRVSERLPRGELRDLSDLESIGVTVDAGGHAPDHLDGADLVVVSPGIPPTSEVIAWARARGTPVWGELELGARLATAPYLAVTGTNGKTTTSGLLAECLRAGGIDAAACGNIGHPFAAAARARHGALVVECSSFQLELQDTFHPLVSVLLNLAPDHLDWHGSYDAYAGAKGRIFANQGPRDVHVGNRDDAAAAAMSAEAPCPTVWFRSGEPREGEVGYVGDELVVRAGGTTTVANVDPERAGFRADVAAAAAAALAFGVGSDAVSTGVAGFKPPRHRGDVVAVVEGVRFVDDSKATNVHAALAALDTIQRAVLIAGGRAKGVDLSPLASRAQHLTAVVAMGESADEVARVFEGLVPVKRAGSIEEAAGLAFSLAPPDGTVLLAPACASWDMFRDYAERGDRFAAAARALGEREAADG
jgi:UDP-N-acetylmuramoylalanine--D-glutamate ligase